MKTRIPLDDRFKEAVIDGRKNVTIRRGEREIPVGRAELVFRSGVVDVEVKSVEYVLCRNLGDEEARSEGLASRSELLRLLERIYPGLDGNEHMTVIRFTLR